MKPFTIIVFTLLSLISKGQLKSNDYLISFFDTSNGREAYGYKTTKGKVVIPAKYDAVATEKFYTFAIVADERGWVGINRKDSVILKPCISDNSIGELHEGLFCFLENGKMGFANAQGQKIIPARFDCVYPFTKGFAAFNVGGFKEEFGEYWRWKDGLWGYINKKGVIVIDPKFSSFSTDDKQYIKAKTKDGMLLYINSYGQVKKVRRKKK
jgi:hypothetical protein